MAQTAALPPASRIPGPIRDVSAPLVLGAALVAVFVIASGLTGYWSHAVMTGLINVVLMLSAGILTGRLGVLALGQLTFAGIGAMVTLQCAVSGVPGGLLVWMLIGAVATVPAGLFLGLISTRLRGATFAIALFSVAATADVVWGVTQFPGNATGLYVDRPAFLSDDSSYLAFVTVIVGALMLLLWLIDRNRLGTSWVEVGHAERAAAARGVNVLTAKLAAFGLSALLAGLAGGLFVGQQGSAAPAGFNSVASLSLFSVAVILGVHHAESALLGGLLLALLPAVLVETGVPTHYATVFFGLTAAVVLKAGKGQAGQSDMIRQKFRARRTRELLRAEQVQRVTAPEAEQLSNVAVDEPGGTALEVTGLTVSFGAVRALEDVTFRLEPGEIVGLLGPNGAGKSTLIDAVTGFVERHDGEVLVAETSVVGQAPHTRARAGVRRSFQQLLVPPSLTVAAFLRSVAARHLSDTDVDAYLDWFDGPPREARMGALDVGTRRIVEVAGLAASRARVIFLDEPAAGQAAAESARLAKAVSSIPRISGSTVVVVEHDISFVREACHSLVVLDGGRVIARGERDDVLSRPEVGSWPSSTSRRRRSARWAPP